MGWNDLDSTWKGVFIGGVTALLSVMGLVFFILLYVGEIIGLMFLIPVAILTLIKLVWGVIIGYFAGSYFKKKS